MERSKWMQKLIHKIGEIDIGYTDREDLEIDIAMDRELDKVYRLGYLDALIEVKSELEMDLEIQKINNYGKK